MAAPFARAVPPASLSQASTVLAQVGRVHIPGLLAPEAAGRLHRAMAEAPWTLALNTGAQGREFLSEHIRALDPGQAARLMGVVEQGAATGFQYLFDSHRISTLFNGGAMRAGALADFYAALNSPDWLEFFRVLTGDPEIAYADAQATRYRSGHFLTTHDDDVDGKGRRYAYVLNLTPVWRPDWGGLLLFYGPDGHVAEGYTPAFNALNLFRVPQPHAVSLVAPFAGADRLSITGWLRTTPDEGAPFA